MQVGLAVVAVPTPVSKRVLAASLEVPESDEAAFADPPRVSGIAFRPRVNQALASSAESASPIDERIVDVTVEIVPRDSRTNPKITVTLRRSRQVVVRGVKRAIQPRQHKS